MTRNTKAVVYSGILILLLAGLAALLMACASNEPTATPIAPAQPAPAVAPTAAPQPAATTAPVQAAPTSTVAVPTPSRILPTATPVDSERPQYGGTLRTSPVISGGDTFDPAFMIQTGFRSPAFAIYSALVQSMPDTSPGPDLAQSWEVSSDGKAVTFHLQPGVKFSDGTPVDAKAVKWNYDRHLDPKVGSSRRSELSPPLERVEAPDDLTVRFILTAPFRPLLAVLMERGGFIVSPTAVDKNNSYSDRAGEFARRPVGSGPFKLQSWNPLVEITLSRNENYWEKGKPYLDAIKYPLLGDKQVEFALLRTGELDVMQDMRSGDVAIARANPQIKVVERAGTSFRFIWFRQTVKPWDNQALRAAMAYAMDRDTFAKALYGGLASTAYQPIGPAYGQWFDSTIKTYAFDKQKAKQKLTEAGYSTGFTFQAMCGDAATEVQWCEAAQSMWADVGIKVEWQSYPIQTHFADFVSRKFDSPILTWISPRNDPHLNIQRLYHTKGSSNATGYGNPQLDSLIEQGATIYDIAKAKEVYNKALSQVAEDAGMIFLVYETNIYGIRSNVRNFATRLDNVLRVRELWLSK